MTAILRCKGCLVRLYHGSSKKSIHPKVYLQAMPGSCPGNLLCYYQPNIRIQYAQNITLFLSPWLEMLEKTTQLRNSKLNTPRKLTPHPFLSSQECSCEQTEFFENFVLTNRAYIHCFWVCRSIASFANFFFLMWNQAADAAGWYDRRKCLTPFSGNVSSAFKHQIHHTFVQNRK